MAGAAVLNYGRMGRGPRPAGTVHGWVVVTVKAKPLSFSAEHVTLRTGMSPVTPGTPAKMQRPVDVLIFLAVLFDSLVVVTLITQAWLRFDQHFLLPGVGGMARCALLIVGNGRVDHLVPRIEGACRIVMTFKADLHASLSQEFRSLSHVRIVAIDARIVIGNG